LPNRHSVGTWSPVVLARLSSSQWLQAAHCRKPFSNSILSGRVVPSSTTSSGVWAFWPMGWEWRNVAKTACSISRNFSPTESI
jgi:hypothetical protein